MNTRITTSLLGSSLLLLLVSSASAQVQRTFVSGLGSDSNPCSRTAPCRTFPQAISQTTSSGEVCVLDSAGYAAFTITKPVSIVAPPGVTAGISVFSGDGITINAMASDVVILRGLTVNNQGSSGNGIVFTAGGTLHIENCVVNGFRTSSAAGLFFNGAGNLEVKSSIMRGNTNGIQVTPSSGTALATIEQVQLEGGGAGLFATDGSKVTVRNSVASGNITGLLATSISTAAVEVNVENCVSSNNSGQGIQAVKISTFPVTVRVSNSTVTQNGTGLSTPLGTVSLLSRGNNTVEGNGTDGSFTGTYTAK